MAWRGGRGIEERWEKRLKSREVEDKKTNRELKITIFANLQL